MISMYPEDVVKEFNKMNTIIENPYTNGNIINRYDDSIYLKYTHCELHPSMMLGVITSIIPLCNHNNGVRNYGNFALSK
jgi:hypothetical protein